MFVRAHELTADAIVRALRRGDFYASTGVTLVDYRNLRPLAPYVYGGTVLLLLGVKSPLGSTVRGTQAWYDSVAAYPAMARQLGAMMAREGFLDVQVRVAAPGIFTTARSALAAVSRGGAPTGRWEKTGGGDTAVAGASVRSRAVLTCWAGRVPE